MLTTYFYVKKNYKSKTSDIVKTFINHSDLHRFFLSDIYLPKDIDNSIDNSNGTEVRLTSDDIERMYNYTMSNKKRYFNRMWGMSTDEQWSETQWVLKLLLFRSRKGEKIYYKAEW